MTKPIPKETHRMSGLSDLGQSTGIGHYLSDQTAIEDFVRGCTFFATGGGGLPKNGIASLASELGAGRQIGWVAPEDIDDETMVACPFLMGSIAPHSPETLREMEGFGFIETVNSEKDRMRKALEELEEYAGVQIGAIIPIELAGANTSAAVAAASALGIAVFDGDFTGRAIPEIHQTTPYLHDKPILPITSVDEWGNVALIKAGTNYRVIERLGKLISATGYGLAGQAGFLMKAREAKALVVQGTLSASHDLGRFIRETRETGSDNMATAIAERLGGAVLLEGTVTKKNEDDRLGYYWGDFTVAASGGDRLKVWFKNENHVSWLNDVPFVTSPDLISLVDRQTGEPIPNPLVEKGQDVAVIATPSPQHFRTPKGIDVLGPRYFGFDIDHSPLETLVKNRSVVS